MNNLPAVVTQPSFYQFHAGDTVTRSYPLRLVRAGVRAPDGNGLARGIMANGMVWVEWQGGKPSVMNPAYLRRV